MIPSFVQYNSPEEGHKQAGDAKEGQDNVHQAALLEATEAPWQVKVLQEYSAQDKACQHSSILSMTSLCR